MSTTTASSSMNLPNRLSLLRVVAVPIFLLFLFAGEIVHGTDPNHTFNGITRVMALVLAIVVAVTDWLDGKIARERQIETTLGKLLDPLADKIFVTAALVAFAEMQLVPAWTVILIIGREFLITGLRSLAAEQGRVIGADRLGKHKTGWQLALIICALVQISVVDFLWASGHESLLEDRLVYYGLLILVWVPLVATVGLTIASGWNYMYSNRDLFKGQL